MCSVHFSSKSDNWSTPPDFFDDLSKEYNFTLDPAASKENAKCKKYFTKVDNGLSQDWSIAAGTGDVWLNPPYGRVIKEWVKKAYKTSLQGTTVVCLLPARTDTTWWHEYCEKGEYYFVRGRLKFGGSKNSAPFPSAIVVFKGEKDVV